MTLLGQTVETGYPIGGFAGNATALATITLLSLAVSLFYLVRGARWQRSVSVIALPWIILSLVLSGSDTTLIAGVVVVLGTVATLIWQRIPNSIRNTVARSRLLFGSAGIVGGIAIIFSAWHVGIESLFTYVPLADGDNLDTRVEKYQAAVDIAREYPLFGLGGANFELVADKYIDGPVNAIHSTPFEFLAGTGVIGLLLYLVLLVVVARYTIRAIDDPSTDHPMMLLLCVWAVGFTMLSMLNLIWPVQTSNSVFWILAGMVVASREAPAISSV
nr:O-antigen ligase family protein [Halalkalicoccus sp. NIPERK01]